MTDIYKRPIDRTINTMRIKHKKNSKLNKKRFDKFIKQNKDFCDDVWSVIKSYVIDKKYINSNFYQENDEIRINRHICDDTRKFNTPYTHMLIGKRFGNLLQIAFYKENGIVIENPIFKMYKTHMIYNNDKNKLTEDTGNVKTDDYEWYGVDYEDIIDGYVGGGNLDWWDEEENRWVKYTPRAFKKTIHMMSCFKIKDGDGDNNSDIDSDDDSSYDDDETDEDDEEMTDEQVWAEHVEEIYEMMDF